MNATADNLFQSIPEESPAKWRDMLTELGPEIGFLRLSYARGTTGTMMAEGDDVTVSTQSVEGTNRMLLVVEGQGIKGQFNPSSLADELHAIAFRKWAAERMKTPELRELRCELTALDKSGTELHTSGVRLRAKKEDPSQMWVSEEELHGGSDPRGVSPRESLNLRRNNEFLMTLVTQSAAQQMKMAENATLSHQSAQQAFQGNMQQVSERVQYQMKELEKERDERIADARADKLFKLGEFALMAWMLKQGMAVPPGMFSGAPQGAPGAPPPQPGPDGSVIVETRAQTLAREILELMDDDKWTLVKSVDIEVAEDLRSALEQHTEGADDLEAALSAVLPRTLPHAPKFAPMLPQEVVARVLELNGLLSR